MKNKWINVDKATKQVSAAAEAIEDEVQKDLHLVHEKGEQAADLVTQAGKAKLDALKKRKLIVQGKMSSFMVKPTALFSKDAKKQEADLSWEMIRDGSWKTADLKAYNLNAPGVHTAGGHLHPLLKVRNEIRTILLLMGFEEMPTNMFVESSFWNFDTLFQPQQHPARDAHDTFFIKEPARAQCIPEEYMECVKNMHEKGGDGSIGWRYDWSEFEARKNILWTH